MLKLEVLGMGFGLILYSGKPVETYRGSSERPPPQGRAGLTAGHSWTLHHFPLLPTPPLSHGVLPSLPASPPTCLPTGNMLGCQPKPCKEGQRPQQKGNSGSFPDCRAGEAQHTRQKTSSLEPAFLAHVCINKKPDGSSWVVRVIC